MIERSVRRALEEMVAERDWARFHSVENLIKSVAIEAGELLECVQWDADPDRDRVREELADVLTYCHLLAARLDLDPDRIVLAKLEETKVKYPVERAHGSSAKYDRLHD